MIKSLITVIIASAIIVSGAVWENIALKKTFNELIVMIDEITLKIEDETAVADDIYALQKLWISKKESLHVYIPHTEIKEIDLWIAESINYVRYKKYDEAIAKLEVVKELCEHIPRTFLIRFENLF